MKTKDEKRGTPDAFKSLQILGQSDIGWDEAVQVNETVDDHGRPFPNIRGFGIPDPNVCSRRVFNDPEVQNYRKYLRKHNSALNFEICEPTEIERALRIFQRDGFVIVRNVLNADQLKRLRVACAKSLHEILKFKGTGDRKYITESGRLPHRYAYGTCSASRHMLHNQAWAELIDFSATTPLLKRIFGGPEYHVWGGGGDVCLPGAIESQHLHADYIDTQDLTPGRFKHAQAFGIGATAKSGSDLNFATKRLAIETTPPLVCVNFCVSDLTWENGPIRQIPGSHAIQQLPPKPDTEPEWMRLSTLVGTPAGAAIFRDFRAWHGGTPNVSKEIRAMPNIEYGAPWLPQHMFKRTMPHQVWKNLSQHGQNISRRVKAKQGVWPSGAGVMHPLASKRRQAYFGIDSRKHALLSLLAKGHGNDKIAAHLGSSSSDVQAMISDICQTLDVSNAAKVVRKAKILGLIPRIK